jgi:hypothetical protein
MELNQAAEKLLKELDDIQLSTPVILDQTRLSIISCRTLLADFRKEVMSQGFQSVSEEIDFFKNIKQVPLSRLIYNKEIYRFEITYPKGPQDKQKQFIKKQVKGYNHFFLSHIDFGQYIQMSDTHFDEYYFTRKTNVELPVYSSNVHLEDSEFNTPKDTLLAQFKAYSLVVPYLRKKLKDLKRNEPSKNKMNQLFWTGSYAAFVEMAYGLQTMRYFNNGNADIKQVIKELGIFLQVPDGNHSRTYNELKSRKGSQIKFFEETGQKLLQKMDDEDGLDN